MYGPDDRKRIRESIIDFARADERITGGAITGSAASDREDYWSDIDLAFGVSLTADFVETVSDFSRLMYESHNAIHHMDVKSGVWVYRVFLLSNSLQVDLAFAPDGQFGALAQSFRMVFGASTQLAPTPKRDAEELVGWGWLYALHVRSSLARKRYWQAEYMISGMRNQLLALACRRYGLPEGEGRGLDDLPLQVTAALSEALVGSLDAERLSRAFIVSIEALICETAHVDRALGERLAGPLRELASRLTLRPRDTPVHCVVEIDRH
jgi:hypothetical protein